MSPRKIIKAVKLTHTDLRIHPTYNVTALAGAQVIDQLPGDVGDDVSHVFLLLPSTHLHHFNVFLLYSGSLITGLFGKDIGFLLV